MQGRRITLLFAAPTALFAFAIAGCPESNDGKSGPCHVDRVRYEGYATDETCVTLVDAERAGAITPGTANAPVLVTPTNGGVIASSSSSITITWDTPLDLDVIDARRAPTKPATSSLATRTLRSLWPISVAWAHEPPVTGAIHRLRFVGIGGSDEPVDIVTSKLTFTFDDELEADLLASDGAVTIELVSMYVTNNLINDASTDGPFAMTPSATITVE